MLVVQCKSLWWRTSGGSSFKKQQQVTFKGHCQLEAIKLSSMARSLLITEEVVVKAVK